MSYPKDPIKFTQWKSDTLKDIAAEPAMWNRYDPHFLIITAVYNNHLLNTPGYLSLNWRIPKAISWVETGPKVQRGRAWQLAPMQIGNARDLGLPDFLGSKRGELIIPPEYQGITSFATAQENGYHNIVAGVGYLLQIAAHY